MNSKTFEIHDESTGYTIIVENGKHIGIYKGKNGWLEK